MAKIVTIDIETSPHIGYVWQAWKQNIPHKMVKEHGGVIMCYAAKYLGEERIIYDEARTEEDEKRMIKGILAILDDADIVIAHNANRFDVPMIMNRALVHGLIPPSPFKVVDTLAVAKKEFKFMHNNLVALADLLGCAPKDNHEKFPGFDLWLECLNQNDEAWAEMKKYNIQDVLTLEEVYLKLRPYIKNHPNVGVFDEGDEPVCPKCGGKHIHYRGYAHTNVSKFRRFICLSCGGWGRTRYNELDKKKRKALVTNVI